MRQAGNRHGDDNGWRGRESDAVARALRYARPPAMLYLLRVTSRGDGERCPPAFRFSFAHVGIRCRCLLSLVMREAAALPLHAKVRRCRTGIRNGVTHRPPPPRLPAYASRRHLPSGLYKISCPSRAMLYHEVFYAYSALSIAMPPTPITGTTPQIRWRYTSPNGAQWCLPHA